MYFFLPFCNNLFMAIMLIRSIIIYVCVLIVIRLMGKRQVGEMQPFEFVVTLIIADLACIPMAELSVPILHGVVPILTLLILHFFICFFARKFQFVRYILTGKPAVVITPKGIDYKELKELNMTLDDLLELLRGCDVFKVSDVAYAIIETNGNLCVIKKSMVETVTREDLKVKVSQSALPLNIIMDGKRIEGNLTLAGITDEFLNECYKRANVKNENNIILMTIDNNGEVFIQEKYSKNYSVFTMSFEGGDKW